MLCAHALSEITRMCLFLDFCVQGREEGKGFAAVTVSIVTAHSQDNVDINCSQSFIARKRNRKN